MKWNRGRRFRIMRNYGFIVSYDGSRYEGWQRQVRTKETIQGKLEETLEKITGEKARVIGAGRTDAGVHALGQYANVHLEGTYPADKLEDAWNRALPDDISIHHLEEKEDRFHSRFSAKTKHYRYRIRLSPEKDVFARRYVWQLGKPLDVESMKKGAALLCGTHDFTSFCGNKHMKKSAIRTVEDILLSEEKGELHMDFYGDGFLQNMIRIMVGTLVEIGEGKRKAKTIPAVFEAKDRAKAGFTAPPQGLSLVEVIY